MELKSLNSSLNFRPKNKRPETLIAFCWDNWQLTSWDKPEGEAIDLKVKNDLSFIQAFKTSHPNLNFMELARIYTLWESNSEFKQELNLDWLTFFKSYNIKFDEHLCRAFIHISNSSLEFQDWLSYHDVSASELEILESLQDSSVINLIGDRVANFSPGKEVGLQAFIWASELYLMGYSLPEVLHLESLSAIDWLSHLKSQRFLGKENHQI